MYPMRINSQSGLLISCKGHSLISHLTETYKKTLTAPCEIKIPSQLSLKTKSLHARNLRLRLA